jgi:hypothetical protein
MRFIPFPYSRIPKLEALTKLKLIEKVASRLTETERLNMVKESIIGSENTAHIDLSPSKLFDRSLLGQGFIKQADSKELKVVCPGKSLDVSKVKALVFGGLDFDNVPAIGALLKYMREITKTSIKNEDEIVATYPYADRAERYHSAITYNKDKSFAPEYMYDFVRQYILPKFLDKSGTTLQEPENPLTLMSFSVGAREICMAENAMRKILLEEFSCSKADVKTLFSYLNAICVAYAVDYENLPDLRFYKTIILSIDDGGILNPAKLAEEVLRTDADWAVGISNIRLLEADDYNPPLDLCFFGLDEVPMISKTGQINMNGHFLPHYIEAIVESPQIMHHISNIIGDVTTNNNTDSME